ncbi:hypothetical protein ACFVHW_15155 [Streptomyces sp. NPDC127110]|uniref:hypothetical protein n=1 Tax=Streptomyces sp. NPDC127110 TaxID=3345362 RepID=UPI00362E1684
MLRGITKSSGQIEHSIDDMRTLRQKLPATYQPTLSPMIKRQSELFGIPESAFRNRDRDGRTAFRTDDEVLDAEIFTFGSILIAVSVYESARIKRSRNEGGETVFTEEKYNYLTVSYATPFVEEPSVEEFEGILSEVWPAIELTKVRSNSRRLREIDGGQPNTTMSPTEGESRAAQILSEKSIRTLAIAIKSANGLLLGDASKQVPAAERARIDELVNGLIESGLIDTEVVVICKNTSAQINRLPSVEAFEQLDAAGLRCACGRLLSAERQEKALSITDFGRTMLDGNRWMSILVLQHLIKFGVPVASIRMEQIYSGEEVDCIAEIHGRIVLFELKDKEFNRGNAYSFGAKIGIFQPDIPVVITTEKVGADARDHFVARSAGSTRVRRSISNRDDLESVTFIEGLSNLESGLEAVVTEVAKMALTPALRSALAIANPSPFALLSAWAGEGRAEQADGSAGSDSIDPKTPRSKRRTPVNGS